MYINWSKLLPAKFTHSNRLQNHLRNPLMRTHPLQTGHTDTRIIDFLMKAYHTERSTENYEYYLHCIEKSHRLYSHIEKCHNFNLSIRDSVKSELESLTRFGITVDNSLHIEACTNALYLMALYDVRNLETSDYLITMIESKGIENCSIHNLGDLLYYFKTYGVNTNLTRKISDLAKRRLDLIDKMISVDYNGGSVQYFERSKDMGYSELEKAVQSNSLLIYFRFKYLTNVMAYYNNNFYSSKWQMIPFWEPVSIVQERRRVIEILEEENKQIQG